MQENILNINRIQPLKKYKNQKMELQKPLKFEGQYFGIQTDSDIHQCFKDSFLQEPLQSSHHYFSEQNTGFQSSTQIIDRIRYTTDIALTPMNELIALAKQDFEWTSMCQEELKRNLKKTKLIEKRERAKNRKNENRMIDCPTLKIFEANSKDRDQDIKKQKNRLSAQISRDRKKQHYMKLEAQNQELKKVLNQLNKNNQELQRKINKESQEFKKPKENSFKMLLIFLGLMFLLNLLRSVVGLGGRKTDENYPISKLQLNKSQRSFVTTQLGNLGIELPKDLLQQPKKEIYIEKKLAEKLFEIKLAIF